MMAQIAQSDESTDIEDLDPEVLEALPDDIRQEIIDGVRDQIPTDVVEQLPDSVADKVPDTLVEAASMSPGLTAVVVLIGLAALGGAVWGAIKGFLKVAVILGVVAAVAWFFFFSGR